MTEGVRGRIKAAVPALAWRDDLLTQRAEQVAQLRAEVERQRRRAEDALAERDALRAQLDSLRSTAARTDELTAQLREYRAEFGRDSTVPSFRRLLMDTRRTTPLSRKFDKTTAHPYRHIPFKLRNYRLAASHGVPVPEVYQVWRLRDQIDPSGLPDEFVIKSDGGAGGHGVLPLRRIGPDRYELIDGTEAYDTAGLKDRLRSRPSLKGPYFAEGMLQQAESDADVLPDDIKVYASYGKVSLVMLRRMPEHGNLHKALYRYVDGAGTDLGQDIAEGQTIDPTIPLPASFDQIVDIAKHLSFAVPLPFLRVDIYDTVDGPVFGELTRTPGGRQAFSAPQDRAMGELWEAARYRIDVDLLQGRPPHILHGEFPAPNLYPPQHVSRSDDPGGWAIHVAPCEAWCRPGRR